MLATCSRISSDPTKNSYRPCLALLPDGGVDLRAVSAKRFSLNLMALEDGVGSTGVSLSSRLKGEEML